MTVLDLFAGAGGLSLGFQNAGFKIIAAVDNWEAAVNIYKLNFKTHPIFNLDLKEETNWDKLAAFKPDIIVGGPPCQDFSSAGKRDETLGRADLTIVFAKIVKKLAPAYFVMENVDRTYKSAVYARAKEIAKNAGYGLTDEILDASYCGVPQKRKRLFLYGELGGQDGVLAEIFEKNRSKERMTLRDYFGDKLGVDYYYRHPRSYKRRGVFSVDEPSPTVRGVNRPVPKTYKPHPGDAAPVDENLRPLTTRERAMIQTFPEDFAIPGAKTELEQLIGNAVPARLAQFVAEAVKERIAARRAKAG